MRQERVLSVSKQVSNKFFFSILFLLVNFFIYSCFLAYIECIFIKQQCIPYNDIAAGKKKVFTYSKAIFF